jgi:hypothetical protein
MGSDVMELNIQTAVLTKKRKKRTMERERKRGGGK